MLGDIPWLSWKSRAARDKEQAEYAAWAFPFGDKQREKVTNLLMEMMPKEDRKVIIIPYLTVKEVYSSLMKNHGMEEVAKERIWKAMERYKRMLPKKLLPYHLALVIEDAKITEELNYPPASELIASAKKIMAEKKARDEAKK